MSQERRRRGKPPAEESERIKAQVYPYFEMGVSAEFASRQRGMPDKEKCKRYFKMLTKEMVESYILEFIEQRKEAIARLCLKLDRLIYDLEAQKNKFTKAVLEDEHNHELENVKLAREGKPAKPYVPNSYLEGMYKADVMAIAELASAKTKIMIEPTINEEIEKAVLDALRKKFYDLQGEKK